MESNAAAISGMFGMRIDSIPHPIIRFGPPMVDSSSKIVSSIDKSSKSYVEQLKMNEESRKDHFLSKYISGTDMKTLLQSFNVFSQILYAYFFIIIFVMIVLLPLEGLLIKVLRYHYLAYIINKSMRENKQVHESKRIRSSKISNFLKFKLRKEQKMVKYFIKKLYRNCIKIFETLLLKPNYDPKSSYAKILWCSFLFFILISISGIALNLVSVEQVAEVSPPKIETLHDLLYEDDFKHLYVTVFNWLMAFQSAKNARPNSDMGKLYTRIMVRPENQIAIPSFDHVKDGTYKKELYRHIHGLGNGSDAWLMETFISDFFTMGFCEAIPKLFSITHYSKPFDEGYIHRVYSINITSGLREIADYRFMTAFELGYYKKGNEVISRLVFSNEEAMRLFFEIDEPPSFEEKIKCYRAMDNSGSNSFDYEKEVKSIKLSGVISLVFLCICIIFISGFMLLTECGIKRFVETLKK